MTSIQHENKNGFPPVAAEPYNSLLNNCWQVIMAGIAEVRSYSTNPVPDTAFMENFGIFGGAEHLDFNKVLKGLQE